MVETRSVDRVDQVRVLTQSLLACAQSGDWDGIAAIEAERRRALHALFDATPQPVEEGVRALLKDVLRMDQEIMSLTQQRRDELSDWLRQMGQGRSALKAYDANTR